MVSLWAWLGPSDVEAYAASLLLPAYMSHLQLAPFSFASQFPNRDGREPLVLTYVGNGRLEEFRLCPREHALPLIQLAVPGIVTARVQLPQDDASWFWNHATDAGEAARIYFAPAAAALGTASETIQFDDSYVSVSRGHVHLGRSAIEHYLRARLRHLGIDDGSLELEMSTPAGGIEFRCGPIGGQLLLDEVAIHDLLRFTRLDRILATLDDYAVVDALSAGTESAGTATEGTLIPLVRRENETGDAERIPPVDRDRY